MENEQRHYELRSGSRSRSQTPLVQTRALSEPEASEHHYDLRTRSREGSHTPGETVSPRRAGCRILLDSSGIPHEQSMETIVERKEEINAVESLPENQNRCLEYSSFASGKKGERRSERQKVKRQVIIANGQSGSREDLSGRRTEKKHKNSSPRRTLTSDYSSEEGEREDLSTNSPSSAHEIYKQAGDWWNVFPKTDYTYSTKSQCRYEIAPGVLAMPNMSRRSIHSDAECLNRLSHAPSESGIYDTTDNEGEHESSLQNSTPEDEFHESLTASRISNSDARSKSQYTRTHVEQYRCHREVIYAVPAGSAIHRSSQLSRSGSSTKCVDSRKYDVASSVDSDTELEEAVSTSSKPIEKWKLTHQFMKFSSIVVVWFSKLLEFLKLKTVRRREYHASYTEYQRYERSWYNLVWRYVDRSLQYVYLFMVKVFFFDSWLLSRASTIRGWMQQRSPRLLWIALLPLLLFTGTYIVQKQSFIRLDSLHNISYDVTETSYRIFNDITNLTSFKHNLLVDYIKKLQNLPIYYVPSVNVSLPEMPSIGCWCAPYFSTFFPLTKPITLDFRKASQALASDSIRSFLKDKKGFEDAGDLKSFAEQLNSRISRLEDQTLEQSDRLLNINEALKQLKETDSVWFNYNSKILTLERRFAEGKLGEVYADEIEAIKLQFETLKELYLELKSCCSSYANLISDEDLEKRVEVLLAHYVDSPGLKKDSIKVTGNIAASGGEKYPVRDDSSADSGNVLTGDHVREIVRDALKIYDADKTGRVDYALESAGGQIISTRCTQRYDIKTRAFKVLAFTLYHENNNPRTVIQGNPIQPGACWAFQGFPGYLLIKLRSPIYVTGFTVEHAPKSILPNGEMKSAPRKFNVWGFVDENDAVPVMFGDYEFAASDDSLQYFPTQNTTIETAYEYVELRVHSNHGQLEYTCLYRFRVHGRPASS